MKIPLDKARHYLDRARSLAHVQLLAALGYPGSRDVHLASDVRIPNPSRVRLGEKTNVSRGTRIECLMMAGRDEAGEVVIGDRVFLGERVTLVSNARITIGRLTMVGHGVSIVDFNHGTARGTPMRDQLGSVAEVVVGEDCWLGAGAIVLPGVTIGDGTVVGAGSVVTASLPPNVVAGGVPARVLKER